MTSPTIVSFYTDDWDYSSYAKQMIYDCERIGINYKIIRLSSLNCYKSNCNMKSNFILESIEELKSPIMWMDVDGTINKIPEYMKTDDLLQFDMAGYTKPWSSRSLFVATLWFNYTEKSLIFLRQWQKNTYYHIDDEAFQKALFSAELNIKILPNSDIEILKGVNDAVSKECYFSHRLSKSDIKRNFKNSQ